MAARAVMIVLLVLVGAPGVSYGAQARAKAYAGRAVADVLRELQATHLKIIFSSERVPPALRVAREPRSTDPREIALQILEPHGLTLHEGSGGTLIVVRKSPRREETRKPAPDKREPAQPAPPPADVDPVRIAEHVDVTDRTTVSGVSPRVYAVEPSEVREMAGGMENVLQSLQVLPGVAGPNDEDGKLAVRGAGPEHNLIVLDGVQIHNAQRLGEFTTGAALRCVDGPSIRLAAGTAAAFESAGRLRLLAGAIYVDSDPEHAANALVVVTAFGMVRHVGTQFELRLQQASLDIRVREGEVSIESAGGRVTAAAGEALLVTGDRPPERRRIASSGPEWAWIGAMAGSFTLEGAALPAFLHWVSREEGLRWEYADAAAKRVADRAVLHGSIEGLTPADALRAVLPAAGLSSRRAGDRLIVRAATE